jgi:hypothetical protein
MTTENRPLLTYRVCVAHHEISVKAHDAAEAIQLARRQLARELPRLYDLICKLATTQFRVENAA